MKATRCNIERLNLGGEGVFALCSVEDFLRAHLSAYAGKVQLIYIDPPYRTGDAFYLSRNGKRLIKPAYTDTLSSDAYLCMLRTALIGCRELLSEDGSLYLHVDCRMAAQLKLMLDELFGASNFMNEIIWAYKSGGRSTARFSRKHDNILFYRKSKQVYFNIDAVGEKRGPSRRNHMKRFIDGDGRVCYSIRSGGKTYIYHEDMPVYPSDVWTDIEHLHQRDPERMGYDTQKPEALLRRIMLASSEPHALVCDLFSGSGTTAAVALKEGRKFIVADSSPYALYTIRKRLTDIAKSLLIKSAPLTIIHGGEHSHPSIEAELNACGGITECEISARHELIYCALGTMSGGAFTPMAFEYPDSNSFTLKMPSCKKPMLYAMDAGGRHGFFSLGND